MQAQINRITNVLRTDTGINWAMVYTEQISWILFLKFLDTYEKEREIEGKLSGKSYKRIIDSEYQRDNWARPKLESWKKDVLNQMTWDDLTEFVNHKLFPYLKSFRNSDADYHSMKYKIWEIFFYMTNRIEQGNTLRDVLDVVDTLNFQSQEDLFELSTIYEDLLQKMWNDWGNSGEFYTPRSVIKAMVQCLDPKIWETIYDWATGSCWFLIEAYNHLRPLAKNSKDLQWLSKNALFGNEQTPLAYIMWVMNMILHGIENPNINKKNTLADNIKDFEEKDRFNIIIANPPFGAKQSEQIQVNFPIKTHATEMLFLQHFMKKLKTGGRAAIIVPEWVLFSTWNAFQQIKKWLLEDFNLHTIVSLPSWVFLPYAWVKTNIIFFDKTTSTSDIRYYEVDPGRKLTKNKPITYEDMQEMVAFFSKKTLSDKSWVVNIKDIKDYDLSAKNPSKIKEVIHETPTVILGKIKEKEKKIAEEMKKLEKILQSK